MAAETVSVGCWGLMQKGTCILGRDPVDRLLSAYEFALEVAVRGLRPNRRPPDPKKVPRGQPVSPHCAG